MTVALDEAEARIESLSDALARVTAELAEYKALLRARTEALRVNGDDRAAAVKRADEAEARLASVRVALAGIDTETIHLNRGDTQRAADAIEAARKAAE